MLRYIVKMRHLLLNNMFFSALERTFTKKLAYEGMQEEERIARIGSNDPESHLGIPYSHVSAKIWVRAAQARRALITH